MKKFLRTRSGRSVVPDDVLANAQGLATVENGLAPWAPDGQLATAGSGIWGGTAGLGPVPDMGVPDFERELLTLMDEGFGIGGSGGNTDIKPYEVDELGGIIITENNAYEIAKIGGRNSGKYTDMNKKPDMSIQKAYSSFIKQIETHESYINDPTVHDPLWESRTLENQQGLIRHWQREANNAAEQATIMREILKERGVWK